jgi:hypothetical protein
LFGGCQEVAVVSREPIKKGVRLRLDKGWTPREIEEEFISSVCLRFGLSVDALHSHQLRIPNVSSKVHRQILDDDHPLYRRGDIDDFKRDDWEATPEEGPIREVSNDDTYTGTLIIAPEILKNLLEDWLSESNGLLDSRYRGAPADAETLELIESSILDTLIDYKKNGLIRKHIQLPENQEQLNDLLKTNLAELKKFLSFTANQITR